jgi:hypothetical protein
MSVIRNPMIEINITRIERSLNLNKLIAAVKKAAVPEIAAHIASMIRYSSPGLCPERRKSITDRIDKKKTAINPTAHFPSFVFGIIYLIII